MAFLLITTAAGGFFRFLPIAGADFPVNDGGLFVVMADDLLKAGFHLPQFTTYNGLSIPYAYPPLGLYLLAVLSRITSLPMEKLIQWLPAFLSTLSIPAFYLLARRLLKQPLAAHTATACFAMTPTLLAWLNYGAGLTRSLGFLFAILTLSSLVPVFASSQARVVLPAGVFAGLTILSHLEWTYFTAISALLIFVFLTPRPARIQSLGKAALTGLLALFISMPWWLQVVRFHGFSAFSAALSAGSGLNFLFPVSTYIRATSEPVLLIIQSLAIAGLLLTIWKREWLLPVWYVLMPFITSRTTYFMLAIPGSLLAGSFLANGLLPFIRLRLARIHLPGRTILLPNTLMAWLLAGIFSFLLAWNALAYTIGYRQSIFPVVLPATRSAMEWSRANTNADGRFLLLPVRNWYLDCEAEWFPWLAGRTSVSTVQGTEWLDGGEFSRRIDRHNVLFGCRDQPVTCIEGWSLEFGQSYDYVLIPANYLGSLRAAILHAPNYDLVFEDAGAQVFKKK